MYVCMYACNVCTLCGCIYVLLLCMFLCMYVRMYANGFMYVCIYAFSYVYVFMYVCTVSLYVCMYVCVCTIQTYSGGHGSQRAQHDILQLVVQIEGHAADEVVQEERLLVGEGLHRQSYVCMYVCMNVCIL